MELLDQNELNIHALFTFCQMNFQKGYTIYIPTALYKCYFVTPPILTSSILYLKISDNFLLIFSFNCIFIFYNGENSIIVTLFIIGYFYNFICKFSDDYFWITNYFKHKEGTENNKPSWTQWQNLTNVSNFTIQASFINLFLLQRERYSRVWNVSYFPFPLPLSLRSISILHILVYVFVLLHVPIQHTCTYS